MNDKEEKKHYRQRIVQMMRLIGKINGWLDNQLSEDQNLGDLRRIKDDLDRVSSLLREICETLKFDLEEFFGQ